MKALKFSLIVASIVALFIQEGYAQTFCMENGTVFTCEGSFQDDNTGCAEGAPYSDASYTYTICPDNPDDVIQVNFVAFNLGTSPNPNNSDYLTIYDGDNTGENSLGSYTGTFLQGIPVTATTNNTSGCLTFVFNPNVGAGVSPGWEALISCTTPCDVPVAASIIQDPVPLGPEQSVGVCMDQDVTFADNGSFAQPGFFLETYSWNFDDGEIDNTTGAVVTHAFDEPGEYIVVLNVEDDNGCSSLNLDPLQVLVSTIPIFNIEWDEQVCLGGEANAVANPESVTWTALPPQVVAGETFLADGAGFSYSTSLTFDFFDPDQVLEDCDDLYSVFVNMEHSYLGDLQIELECPNGTTVILLEYPNGGGGTFLGEAIDDGGVDPGVGYDYYWDPDAVNGDLGENANGGSLPAGTYESEYDMCDFVGCPLNGDWTMSIIDNLAIDNGYIFYWGINFNPALFPGITTFTPIVGLDADSSYWDGPFITTVSDDGNSIGVTPPDLGFYDYTYTALNNFSCSFDTTITIEVVPGPTIDAGMDMNICNDALQLEPTVSVDGDPADCVYTLIMEDTFGDGWNGHQVQIIVDGNVEYTFTLGFGDYQEETFELPGGSTYEIVLLDGGFNGEVFFSIEDDLGNEIFSIGPNGIPTNEVLFTAVCGGFGNYVYEWSPPDGLSDTSIPNPTVLVDQTTEYTVTVYPDGYPGCAASDDIIIAVDPAGDPGQDSTMVICFNFGQFNLIDVLQGDPVDGGIWTNSNGDEVDGTFNSLTDPSDVFTYTVTNLNCVASAQVDITVIPQGDPICCEFTYDVEITGVTCFGYTDGQFDITVFESTEGGPWTIDINGPMGPMSQTSDFTMTFTDLVAGDYSFTITDAGLCTTTELFTIDEPEILTLEASPDTVICVDGTALLEAWSDMDPGNWVYSWDGGLGNGDAVFASPVIETTYSVFATSNEGCLSDPVESMVSVHDSLTVATVMDTLVCQASEAYLLVDQFDGGIGPYEYFWTFQGVEIGAGDSVMTTPVVTSTYCVSISDACETPEVEDCMIVNVEVPIDVIFEADTTRGCHPADIEFYNLVDPALYDAQIWTTGDGGVYSTDTVSHTYQLPGIYDVSLTLISPIGCSYSETESNYIIVFPPPFAGFHAEPQPTQIPDTEISFYDFSEGNIVEWYWTFDTTLVGGSSTDPNPVFEFPDTYGGIYPVTLTVIDENGCSDEVTRFVEIDDLFNIYVPNSFSPNDDGVNDVFYVQGTDIDPTRFQMYIYNRWGELVFETEDLYDVWIGNHEGGEYFAHPEIFNWRLVVYSATTAERKEIFGTVTLLR